jgi:holo-[acyl-carrier protein] synthase
VTGTRSSQGGDRAGIEGPARDDRTVIGIGIDAVDVERFRKVLQRRPRLVDRLFTADEQAYANRQSDPTQRYAARFAAKEAVLKALGVGLGRVAMTEIEVVREPSGAPGLRLWGGAAALAEASGVARWRLSLTHTDIIAQAVAVAE